MMFNSEWVSEGRHRVFIECRGGAPTDYMRDIVKIAAFYCDNCQEADARVVKLFYDNKADAFTVFLASDEPEAASMESALTSIMEELGGGRMISASMVIVPIGNKKSDHYDHMQHLSIEAGKADWFAGSRQGDSQ
jgi:hypothetical protein